MQLNRPFATVTPTLDGDVLGVLAGSEVTFTVSQISRILTTASGEGIRKVLNRLTAQGVVIRDHVGATHTYRLNTQHLAAEPILALSRLISKLLTLVERRLDSWSEPAVYAAVFGSAATGQMTLGSDIDIFIVRGDRVLSDGAGAADAWEEQLHDLARSVTAWTGNDTRIIDYTADGFRRAAAAGEPLLREVAKQGLTVAGSRSWLVKQLSSAVAHGSRTAT